jgi:hypothetical protein
MNSKQLVLTTGSSTRFGRLFVDTLARKGHTVFATIRDPRSRNAKNASEILTLAAKDSLPIYVLELDVTDDASVEPNSSRAKQSAPFNSPLQRRASKRYVSTRIFRTNSSITSSERKDRLQVCPACLSDLRAPQPHPERLPQSRCRSGNT